jgi:hypothetical protein
VRFQVMYRLRVGRVQVDVDAMRAQLDVMRCKGERLGSGGLYRGNDPPAE